MRLLLALALILVSGTAQAQSIVGDWACLVVNKPTKRWEARTYGPVRFAANLTSKSQMQMEIFDGKKRKVAVAAFVYSSRYKLEGDKLYDIPVSAKVTKFTAGEHDLSQAAPARQLQKGLMRKQKKPASISFPSAKKLVITPAKGAPITCNRVR